MGGATGAFLEGGFTGDGAMGVGLGCTGVGAGLGTGIGAGTNRIIFASVTVMDDRIGMKKIASTFMVLLLDT